jgi:hypothetical protein
MKKIAFVKIAIITVSIFLQGCSNTEPTNKDVIGWWRSEDGAKLKFKQNGTFEAELLPGELFFARTDDFNHKRFNGSGKWLLKEKQGLWEISLNFDKVLNQNRYDTQILLSGSSGLTEKSPPWYLFEWKDEEGGERYSFKKY